MATRTAAHYDAWYSTERGAWIGEQELRLLTQQLRLQSGDNLLDVGCGTGWFTRRFARLSGVSVTGIDINPQWLAFARQRDAATDYVQGDARALPFADNSFERSVSVTALCFVDEWQLAIKEMLRVTRTRFVIGLLNRNSWLWHEKGQQGGSGAYPGAHWHSIDELSQALAAMPVADISYQSAVFLPSATPAARYTEIKLSNDLDWGSFLVVSGDIKK